MKLFIPLLFALLFAASPAMAVRSGGTRGGGDPREVSFIMKAKYIDQNLLTTSQWTKIRPRFQDALESTRVRCGSQDFVRHLRHENQLAFYEPGLNTIFLDCVRWDKEKDADAAIILTAHEYFRVLGLEGKDYKYSQRLIGKTGSGDSSTPPCQSNCGIDDVSKPEKFYATRYAWSDAREPKPEELVGKWANVMMAWYNGLTEDRSTYFGYDYEPYTNGGPDWTFRRNNDSDFITGKKSIEVYSLRENGKCLFLRTIVYKDRSAYFETNDSKYQYWCRMQSKDPNRMICKKYTAMWESDGLYVTEEYLGFQKIK